MLKGIDPLLGPELLANLRAMGHGDTVAIVDANFPASSCARALVRLDGVGAARVVEAILSVLPLDAVGESAGYSMMVIDRPDAVPPIVRRFADFVAATGERRPITALSRDAFYTRAREAALIVATGERQLYGNLLLAKGALEPDA